MTEDADLVQVDMDTTLADYVSGAAELEAFVRQMGERAWDLVRAPGSWTVRQIVHHLVDGDVLWSIAIKMALGGGESAFDLHWYWEKQQDEWAACWGYAGRALEPSLALLRAHREHIAQIIRAVPGAWRCGVEVPFPDGERHRFTTGAVIDMQARHARQHLDEIRSVADTYAALAAATAGPGPAATSDGRRCDLPERYEILVQGELDARWSDWFDGFAILRRPGNCSQLSGVLSDQAALYGLLAKIRDIGLPLLGVRRIE